MKMQNFAFRERLRIFLKTSQVAKSNFFEISPFFVAEALAFYLQMIFYSKLKTM